MNIKRARRIAIANGIDSPMAQYLLSRSKHPGRTYLGRFTEGCASDAALSKIQTIPLKPKLNFDPKIIRMALDAMQKILTKDIPPPEGGGWEVLSKPMQQEGFEKTYLVEFNLDRYATMKSDHNNNNRFVKELASLMGVNRKIIFLLPHLHTISPNVLLCLKDLDFAMRANYGELLICTSDYGSYSMLHNERLNVHWELDDALEALRFEKSMEASRGDKVYFPSSGVNYVGP